MASFVQQLIGEISRATQGSRPYELSMNSSAPTEEEVSEIPVMAAEPRKGMFGIKGQARDILGLIGDAFLVQGGADPIYRQQRLNERIADALRDYGTDELGAISALASVPGADKRVQEMMDNYQQNEVRRGTLKNTIRKTDSDIAENNLQRDGIVLGRVASMMDSVKGDPVAWTLMRDQALKYAANKGVELPYGIPDKPSEDFIYREVKPEDVARLKDTEAYRDATLGLERSKLEETKKKNAAEQRDQAIRTAATTAGTYSEAAKRLDDIQNPKGKKARRDAPIKAKVGDPIWRGGEKYIVTAVDSNGAPTKAKPAK